MPARPARPAPCHRRPSAARLEGLTRHVVIGAFAPASTAPGSRGSKVVPRGPQNSLTGALPDTPRTTLPLRCYPICRTPSQGRTAKRQPLPDGRSRLGISGVCDTRLRPRPIGLRSGRPYAKLVRGCVCPRTQRTRAADRQADRRETGGGDQIPRHARRESPAAKRCKRSRRGFGHLLPDKGADRQPPRRIPPELVALVSELMREKNNLNQLTKIANTDRDTRRIGARLERLIGFYDELSAHIKSYFHDRKDRHR